MSWILEKYEFFWICLTRTRPPPPHPPLTPNFCPRVGGGGGLALYRRFFVSGHYCVIPLEGMSKSFLLWVCLIFFYFVKISTAIWRFLYLYGWLVQRHSAFFFLTGWHIPLPTYLSANKCLFFFINIVSFGGRYF